MHGQQNIKKGFNFLSLWRNNGYEIIIAVNFSPVIQLEIFNCPTCYSEI